MRRVEPIAAYLESIASVYSHLVEGAKRDALTMRAERVASGQYCGGRKPEDSADGNDGNARLRSKEKSPCYRAFNGCGDRI